MTLLEELALIDKAVLADTATTEQENRGQDLVRLADAAPALFEALLYFFNIMHDYESSRCKGYVIHALHIARSALENAKGGAI